MAISLSSLQTGKDIKPPRIVIHGTRGIGKTTFAAGAIDPVFIFTEEGLGLLDVPRFPLASTWKDVLGSLTALYKEEHKFKTVVIDSADWLEKLVWAEVREVYGEKIFFDYGKGYVHAANYFDQLVSALDILRNKKGMSVILVAHTIVKRFDAPDVPPFERYKLDLHDKAASVLEEWADVVLFATAKVFTTSTDVGFDKKVVQGVGSGERVLYTEERPAHVAKNRYHLPYQLPLSYKALAAAMEESINPQQKEKHGKN